MKKFFANVPKLLFENRPWFIAFFQALLVLSSLVLAWLLRFDFSLPFRHLLMWTAPILITVCFYLIVISLGFYAFPRSVYLLEAVLTAGLLSGGRLMSRVLAETMRRDSKTSKKVIIIGAGFAAQMVIREIAHSGSGYCVLGCLDDDESKLGIAIHGVTVLGKAEQLSA